MSATIDAKVLAVTCNLSGKDTTMTRKEWSKSRSGEEWLASLQKERKQWKSIPNIVVLALQEWDTSNKFYVAFGDWLRQITSRRYRRKSFRLTTLLRYVGQPFSQSLHIYYLVAGGSVQKISALGTTCFGESKTCTKGSLAVQVTVSGGRNIIIIGSHFPRADREKRDAAYQKTMQVFELEERGKTSAILWLGDFNYRMVPKPQLGVLNANFPQQKDVISPSKAVKTNANNATNVKEELEGMIDELRLGQIQRQTQGWIFSGFNERGILNLAPDEMPNFYPTCKMVQADAKTPEAEWKVLLKARQTGDLSAYVHGAEHMPSYCDRILVKSAGVLESGVFLRVHVYQPLADGMNLSDHNAVMAVMEMKAGAPTTPAKRATHLRARRRNDNIRSQLQTGEDSFIEELSEETEGEAEEEKEL